MRRLQGRGAERTRIAHRAWAGRSTDFIATATTLSRMTIISRRKHFVILSACVPDATELVQILLFGHLLSLQTVWVYFSSGCFAKSQSNNPTTPATCVWKKHRKKFPSI